LQRRALTGLVPLTKPRLAVTNYTRQIEELRWTARHRSIVIRKWAASGGSVLAYETQPSSLPLALASFHASARNSFAVIVTRGSSLFAVSTGNSPGQSFSLKYLAQYLVPGSVTMMPLPHTSTGSDQRRNRAGSLEAQRHLPRGRTGLAGTRPGQVGGKP
jgi:hypothetical protein